MAINDILVKLKLDTTSYDKGLSSSVKKTETFSKKSSANIAKVAASFLSVGLAVNQITKGFKDLAQETTGLAKVDSVLKSTGGVAGVTAQNIEAITLAMQKNTTTSQDSARNVAALGLTFTKINKDIFPEYLKMSADMATVTGQDMSQSALQLGKALQDPVLGATSLRRVGVNLTKQQQEQIKVFTKMGQTAKAQAIIMKELAVEFGGAAKAVGMTFFGSVKRAMNAVDDFRKQFIKGLGAGAFGGVQKVFNYIIDNQEVIGDNFRKIGYIFTHNFIMDGLKGMAKLLKFSFDGWVQIGDLWKDIFGESFFTTVVKGWKMLFIVVESGWKMIVETVTNGIITPIEKTFNKIKAIGTFLTGGDYSAALEQANAQNASIGDRGFSSNINRLFEEMNEKVFAVNTGQDVRQRNADFAFSKSTFDLTGGTGDTKMTPAMEMAQEHYTKTETAQQEHWQTEALNRAKEAQIESEKREKARLEELARQDAFRTQMLNMTAQTFTGIETAFNALTNSSLNIFGKGMGVIGGFAPMLDAVMPGLGSAVGAGAGMLGTIFGQADEENGGSESGSVYATALKSDSARPSATITKTGPETVNYYISNDIKTGMIIGEYGIDELASILTQKQKNQQLSMI
jgi:hypothetical protein